MRELSQKHTAIDWPWKPSKRTEMVYFPGLLPILHTTSARPSFDLMLSRCSVCILPELEKQKYINHQKGKLKLFPFPQSQALAKTYLETAASLRSTRYCPLDCFYLGDHKYVFTRSMFPGYLHFT